jgi:hypothetical protein
VLIMIGLLIGGARWLWQWRLARRRTPRQMAVAVYWVARRALGISAEPSTTPDEFLAATSPSLENMPAVWPALRELTALYLRAAFSPHPIPSDEAHLALVRWRRAWPAWWRLTRWAKPNRGGMVKSRQL